MILHSLALSNLKCFSALCLGLSPLTLFTGFNAAGKSSALHALLLLSQGLRLDSASEHLPINGPLIRLGSPEDVFLDQSNKAEISVAAEQEEISWHFDRKNAFQIEKVIHRTASRELREWSGKLWEYGETAHTPNSLIGAIREVIFLGAARGGTPEVYPVPDAVMNIINADVGNEGQFAPWWYAQSADDEIGEERCHSQEPAASMRRQLDAYLSELFPNAEAAADNIERTSLVRMGLRTGTTSVYRRPANIGYGLTYAFPILVALLLARRDQILIIESPEANLHPRAQSRMGGILARFAAAGVQILVESHSDHVLNGMRLAVKNQVIPHSDVTIHFFQGVDSEGNHGVISPSIDSQGTIDSWPNGFFDQGESDLAILAGWKEDT